MNLRAFSFSLGGRAGGRSNHQPDGWTDGIDCRNCSDNGDISFHSPLFIIIIIFMFL